MMNGTMRHVILRNTRVSRSLVKTSSSQCSNPARPLALVEKVSFSFPAHEGSCNYIIY